MSLLVTSITMGKQPDRLLDKGPQYLRTRTNRGLFAHHRKSAVELLAASKSQFYKCPSVSLDDTNHVTGLSPPGRASQSETGAWQEKKPTRSKSEFDISALKDLSDETENENPKASGLKKENTNPLHWKAQRSPLEYHEPKKSNFVALNIKSQAKDNFSSHPKQITKDNFQSVLSTNCATSSRKPVPFPRKKKETPALPPRKPSLEQSSNTSLRPPVETSRKHSLDSNQNNKDCKNKNIPQTQNTGSLVANLRKRFNSLGANRTSELNEKNEDTSKDRRPRSIGNEILYQATPIFIPNPDLVEGDGVFRLQTNEHLVLLAEESRALSQSNPSNEPTSPALDNEGNQGREAHSDASMSNKSHSKLERKGSNTDSNSSSGKSQILKNNEVEELPPAMTTTLTPPGVIVEMSIESVDQVVCCNSEANAIPAAVTTSADSLTDENNRSNKNNNHNELSRKNQSITGKMDASLHESSLRPSHSPSHFNPSLPRSHSDIGCRLEIESHHSRDSSLVSNHSRLSRASAGADLEQFFNQMGLEKGVLEPLNRLRELQNSEVLASVSSLDSHDAASICSSFSADNDNSESQALECAQHPTSVVERNARIIKWLCNVRKAKTPLQLGMSVAAVSESPKAPAAAASVGDSS